MRQCVPPCFGFFFFFLKMVRESRTGGEVTSAVMFDQRKCLFRFTQSACLRVNLSQQRPERDTSDLSTSGLT